MTNVTNNGLIAGSGGLLLNVGGYNMGGGTLALSGTNTASFWGGNDGGTIVIQAGGLLNNRDANLTSWAGGVITINSGGTLNADSAGQGESLNLRNSLLVNNGAVLGTTNVGFGAAISGSGSFGTVNVSNSGQVDLSGGTMRAASVAISTGTIEGNGLLAPPAAIATAATLVPSSSQTLTLANDLTGSGELVVAGPGFLVLAAATTTAGGQLSNKGPWR